MSKYIIYNWRKKLSFLVLSILLILIIYYITRNYNQFLELKLIKPYLILILIPLLLLHLIFTGFMNEIPSRIFGIKLTIKEIFQLAVITRFYNLITPFRGGMVARGMYLKKKYNFAYTDFLATLAASYVIVFLVSSFIGLMSVYLIFMIYGVFSWIITLIFLGMFFGMLFIVIISPKFPEGKNKWINRIVRILNGWHLIKEKKKVIFLVGLMSVLQVLTGALMLYLQFKVFGFEISYIKSLFLTCIGSLGILIAITPANLGVSEAITVFSALTLGIGVSESLSAALLGRAVSVIMLFILGPLFSYILVRKSKS